MSITLRACVIDADAYRRLQGSGDVALVERVSQEAARFFAMEDSWAVQLRADHLPIATAVRDIIDGTLRVGRSAALSYNVAALLLAEHLGERIDDEAIAERPEDVQPAIDDAITDLVAEYGGVPGDWPLLATVLVRGPTLEIPWVRETLPNGTGLVSAAEALRASRIVARIPAQEDDAARELAMIYGGWLRRAAEENRALLLACD